MARRYAILDDNQHLLESRLAQLGATLPALVSERIRAVAVIGSVAEGTARDESDLDLLIVLREGGPCRGDYRWWDEQVAPRLSGGGAERFPVQPVIVARESLDTSEPNLRGALRCAIPLWDPDGLLA
jgi:hypothetical protein